MRKSLRNQAELRKGLLELGRGMKSQSLTLLSNQNACSHAAREPKLTFAQIAELYPPYFEQLAECMWEWLK